MLTKLLLSESSITTDIIENLGSTDNLNPFAPGAIRSFISDNGPLVLNFCVKVIIAIIILLVGIQIIRLIMRAVGKAFDKINMDASLKHFLVSIIRILLYFLLIMIILARFGVTAGSVVAIIGSVGLSIGLALQGSLANFAGGVLILLQKPFKIGDYIVEDANGNEGVVTEISLIYTKLLTVDNKTVVLPNGTLANTSLTNVTMQKERNLDLKFNISYQADLRKAKEVVKAVLENEEGRVADKEVTVFVDSLADSCLVLGARVWIKSEDYWNIRWRILENVKLALDENEIAIPYPQMDVHINQ